MEHPRVAPTWCGDLHTQSAPSPGGPADTPTQGPFLPRPTLLRRRTCLTTGFMVTASRRLLRPRPPQHHPVHRRAPYRLAEPAAHSSASKGRSRGPWLGLAGLGLALVIGSFGVVTESETVTEVPVHGQRDLLGVSSNDVEVVGGAPAGTIEVTRRFEWGLGGTKPKLNETWDDGGVAISGASCQGVSWRCGVDYIVRVPDNVAVELRGGSGDVVLGGSLGTIDVEVGSGDIEADGLSSADVRLQTGSGDVDLGLDSRASKVDVRTGSGDLDLSLDSDTAASSSAPQRRHRCRAAVRTDSLDIETGSGDVSVDAPDADQFRLDVDTGSGDQNVDVPSSPTADQLIKVRTGSGDVEIN